MNKVEIVYNNGLREVTNSKRLQWLLGIKDIKKTIFTYKYL